MRKLKDFALFPQFPCSIEIVMLINWQQGYENSILLQIMCKLSTILEIVLNQARILYLRGTAKSLIKRGY